MESRIVLAVVTVLILAGMVAFNNPSITGFVPSEVYHQSMSLFVDGSQEFKISSVDGGPLRLLSLAISGSTSGSGLVKVYLRSGKHTFLVFTNQNKPKSAMEAITGLAVREVVIEAGDRIDRIESLPDDALVQEGGFVNACVDTCSLNPDFFNSDSVFLDIIVEPGSSLRISELRFTVDE